MTRPQSGTPKPRHDGWWSKVGAGGSVYGGKVYGPAHYIFDGAPLCASLNFRDGPALSPFLCLWTEWDGARVQCRYCVRLVATGWVPPAKERSA